MRRQLLAGLLMVVVMTVLTGVVYPLVVTGVASIAFPHRAGGSLVRQQGKVVGSSLIGQSFLDATGQPLAQYFQPRPSAAGKGYDALQSGPSNLGPSNPKLLDAVAQRTEAYRQFNGLDPSAPVPVDAVTASGSGLDPDISVANAMDQLARVAQTRHRSLDQIRQVVDAHINERSFGFLGEKTVNVLDLNLALDRLG